MGIIIGLTVITVLLLLLFTAANPVGTAVGFLLSSVAMLVVLFCYRWLDRWEPEPRRLLQLAFLWGASVAVVLAVGLESVGESMLATRTLVSQSFDAAAIQAPFIEEAAKGLFLLLMMTGRRRNELNSLTDCMVYAGITAVGFAWMEDIVYIADTPVSAVVRLIFAPFAHPLFTTMTGIGVFFALRQRRFSAKATVIALGYLAAVAVHALWNGSLTLGDGGYFVVVYLFWMVPVFVLMIVLAAASRRGEQRLVATKLPGMVAAGLITPGEAGWLGSLRGRRTAIRAAKHAGGRRAAKSVGRFAAAVVEVAFTRDRIDRGFGDQQLFELQDQQVQNLVAARYAAPALQGIPSHLPR